MAQLGEAETCAVSGDGCGGGGDAEPPILYFLIFFHVFSTVAQEREVSGPPPRARDSGGMACFCLLPSCRFCGTAPVSSKGHRVVDEALVAAQDWTNKHVKQWQARHLCLHSIERSLAAYVGRRYAAVVTNPTAAVGGERRAGLRVLRKEGTDSSLGGGPPTAEPPQVTVTKFIMPHGNHGKDAKLLPKPPAGEPEPDSDDPDGDAPSFEHGVERSQYTHFRL